MAIETRNQIERNDNRTLWIVLTLIAIAILAYASYAAYQSGDYPFNSNRTTGRTNTSSDAVDNNTSNTTSGTNDTRSDTTTTNQ